MTYEEHVASVRAELDAFERAYYTAGPRGVLDAMRGRPASINWMARNNLWAAAMTAQFGPVGVHESYLSPDGEAILVSTYEKFPRIRRSVERSHALIICAIDQFRRDVERQS